MTTNIEYRCRASSQFTLKGKWESKRSNQSSPAAAALGNERAAGFLGNVLSFFPHREKQLTSGRLERCHRRMYQGHFPPPSLSGNCLMWASLKVKTESDQFSKTSSVCFFLFRPAIYRKYLYAYKQKLLSGAPSVFGRWVLFRILLLFSRKIHFHTGGAE